jgi:hypothetical protein
VTTIALGSGATRFRQVVFSRTWSTTGTHTLRLVAAGGTTGHARLDIDAIALLR